MLSPSACLVQTAHHDEEVTQKGPSDPSTDYASSLEASRGYRDVLEGIDCGREAYRGHSDPVRRLLEGGSGTRNVCGDLPESASYEVERPFDEGKHLVVGEELLEDCGPWEVIESG